MILAPDAEAVVLTALRRAEPYVTMNTKAPPGEMPATFVRVRRIGGTMLGRVRDVPRLDVLIFGTAGDAERMALAQRLRAALAALPGSVVAGVPVYRVAEVAGPVRLPDPINPDRSIILFTFSIELRATEAH